MVYCYVNGTIQCTLHIGCTRVLAVGLNGCGQYDRYPLRYQRARDVTASLPRAATCSVHRARPNRSCSTSGPPLASPVTPPSLFDPVINAR
ncbi:unnamed protein product [Arctia plantaginis]|uniref:Uncharacterized protein n=1 Tax=Arctia plantaginis TaxID=874455 RepID=A0A8S1BAJ7_ARCPL|nr:unnamed protein product [Arctia plantaginis]